MDAFDIIRMGVADAEAWWSGEEKAAQGVSEDELIRQFFIDQPLKTTNIMRGDPSEWMKVYQQGKNISNPGPNPSFMDKAIRQPINAPINLGAKLLHGNVQGIKDLATKPKKRALAWRSAKNLFIPGRELMTTPESRDKMLGLAVPGYGTYGAVKGVAEEGKNLQKSLRNTESGYRAMEHKGRLAYEGAKRKGSEALTSVGKDISKGVGDLGKGVGELGSTVRKWF